MSRNKKQPCVLMIEGSVATETIVVALENLELVNKKLHKAIKRNNTQLDQTRRLLGGL